MKTPEQLLLMRRAGLVTGQILETVCRAAVPGVSTLELDALAREGIAAAGAKSSFLGYGGSGGVPFPAVICASVNDQVVHGIPDDVPLAEGDLLSIDFGVELDGWHGDSARTVEIGVCSAERSALNEATRVAMWDGIAAMRAGGRVGDIGAAVQASLGRAAGGRRYGIVREYTGHGIGTAMHMEPSVPNLGRRGQGERLGVGMCLAVEPMATTGRPAVAELDDDWTVVTRDGSAAAHWEHSVAIMDGGLWVLTALDGGAAELGARGVRVVALGE